MRERGRQLVAQPLFLPVRRHFSEIKGGDDKTSLEDLEPASATSTLLPGGVGGDGGAVLDAADLHTGTGQGTEGLLGA